ncbi:hypothetical protein HDU89_000205 [Geranomyces variabilis]|nr:hypothetical protein HDU89_000205 [Geranomyces variabilis]
MQASVTQLSILVDDASNITTCGETHAMTLHALRDFTQVVEDAAEGSRMDKKLERQAAMLALSAWLQQPYMDVERLAEVDELWSE